MSLLIDTLKRDLRTTHNRNVGKVLSVAYQRNGCCGTGFYTVNFTGVGECKGRTFWAVVTFENDENDKGAEAFVFDPASPGDGWRGTDRFGPELFAICRAAKWPHEVVESAAN